MDRMIKFRIEDAFLREAVGCMLEGKHDDLEQIKVAYAAFHKALGKSQEDALTEAETMIGVAEDFAFGG